MRRRKYGVTAEDYFFMLEAQGWRCAVCGDEFVGSPHIDHDHVTGRVRGLLCGGCNCGIGQFKDSIVRLEAAIAYLERA
jgi:hypothetical protein